MSSASVFHEKIIQEDGSIVEMKIQQVPKSDKNPDGLKYSLYCVSQGRVRVGYDNHHPKGHHRHYGQNEEPYKFTTVENLIRDFKEDVRRLYHEGQNDTN